MRRALAESTALPEEFWADPAVTEALGQRDIGQLFRLVQRATRATQTRIGVSVGLSQAQVSEIISGSRKVSSVDVLARIVGGLHIPEPARSVLFLGDASVVPQRHNDLFGSNDITAVYAMRGLIPRPHWNDIVRRGREHLWLYGMAELGFALDDEVPGILEVAARHGCDIRVLLLDPDFHGTSEIDTDEGSPPGTLVARIRSALARYEQMREKCGARMTVRVYHCSPTVSIVRGDDRMLVTPYLRFSVGSNSPSLELRRTSGRMFDRYIKHFQCTWERAKDWMP